jgi:hypothetical protein
MPAIHAGSRNGDSGRPLQPGTSVTMAPSSMQSARRAFIAALPARQGAPDASESYSSEHRKQRKAVGFGLAFVAIREIRPERPKRI